MKKVRSFRLSYVMAALLMLLAACSDNNKIDFNATDSANVEGEGTSDAYADDALDVSTGVVGGVTATQFAGRENEDVSAAFAAFDKLKCATITIVRSPNSTKDNPSGVITIAYPADGSCKDSRGVARKGKIIITYTGPRFAVNSKIVTTFADFFIAGVKVEGTHTLTNVTPTNQAYPRFNVLITDGKLTFLTGKTVTRTQNITREWQRATNPLEDKWVLLKDGTATGTNRDGKEYLMTITKDLVYSRPCQISNKVFIAVSGEKTFVADNKLLTLNYGDGSCDNKVTITINGKSTEVEIKGDGN
jgi:hypothetical protein